MELITTALMPLVLAVGIGLGIGAERYSQHLKFRRMKERIEHQIDARGSDATAAGMTSELHHLR